MAKRIENSHKLLRYLIKNMDKNNEVEVELLFQKYPNNSSSDFSELLKELKEKGYVSFSGLDIIKVKPAALERNIPLFKRFIFKTNARVKKIFLTIILTIISVAFATIIEAIVTNLLSL